MPDLVFKALWPGGLPLTLGLKRNIKMKFLATFCKVLGYVWLTIAGIVIFIGVVGVWMREGFSGVQELLSPFNIANWLITVITLAPGIGLFMLSDKLRRKTT
jgi:hypothetical protein